MPPGMPDTCVKHIRRNLRTCLLELPGELLDARNCLQLLGALLQNLLEVFSWTGLCEVPRSNISHTQVKSRLLQHRFCAFLFVSREFLSDMKILCWHLGRLCAWSRHVTIAVNSVNSFDSQSTRLMGGAIANTSFDAWVEDEPPCMLACTWMTL